MSMSLSQPGRGEEEEGGEGRGVRGGMGGERREEKGEEGGEGRGGRRRERREEKGEEGYVDMLLTSSTSTVLSDSHLRRGSPMPAGRGSTRASSPITVQREQSGEDNIQSHPTTFYASLHTTPFPHTYTTPIQAHTHTLTCLCLSGKANTLARR